MCEYYMHSVKDKKPPRTGKRIIGRFLSTSGYMFSVVRYKKTDHGGQFGKFIWEIDAGEAWAEECMTH
jgi:hypothetical protein